jgi:hypothetical protein
MSQRNALTVGQRETIYREKLDGHSLKELAQAQHCSESCARKWWRIGRDHGVDGLHQTKRARSAPGVLRVCESILVRQARCKKNLFVIHCRHKGESSCASRKQRP